MWRYSQLDAPLAGDRCSKLSLQDNSAGAPPDSEIGRGRCRIPLSVMSSSHRKFVVLALLAGLALPLSAQKKTAHQRARQSKPAAAREPAPAPPPAAVQPPPPPRPEQLPPTPPQVTYRDGQLAISADNCTLSSVLSAVRARTGASLDIPPDTASDRVAVRLGPGDPRDVLSQLLQGSRFNYVLLGSEDHPEGLSQIILTPRAGAAGAAPAVAAGAPPAASEEEEDAAAEAEPAPQLPAPAAVPAAMPSPMAPPAAVPEIVPSPPDAQQPSPGQPPVKTPEQMLEELQRMRQQQQLQNRPGPPNRPQGPQRQPPE